MKATEFLTDQQKRVAVDVILAVSEAIRTAKQIPSGHLYSMLIGKIDIDGYTSIIRILKNAKLVSESMNMLTWIGPEVN